MISDSHELMPSEKTCLALLQKLIRFNTCQPDGHEEIVVDWILNQLPNSIKTKKISHGRDRASLIIKIDGKTNNGGLALMGHLDTVACSEGWHYPPHAADVNDHLLYGRGASDMKGGDAAMLLTLKNLIDHHFVPNEPVYFCFTADEEAQGIGVQSIVASHVLDQVKELIVCEPSNNQISNSEKGAFWMHFTIHGVSSHASRPTLGVNAIEYALDLGKTIKSWIQERSVHPILGPSTAAITRLTGGFMTNIIPSQAEMEMDIRTNPDLTTDQLISNINSIIKDLSDSEKSSRLKIKMKVINNRPAIETNPQHPMVQTLKNLGRQFGIESTERGHFFYTDASQFIPAFPIPFVIAGPGDDAQAHCVDEHIDVRSIQKFTALYSNYIVK